MKIGSRTISSIVNSALAALIVFALGMQGAFAAQQMPLKKLKSGGYVILLRHAATDTDVADPPGFRLDDCATQRNLNTAGREQAKRLGELFANQGIPIETVLSSQFCRCVDTALLAFGKVEYWLPLNSIFDSPPVVPDQVGEVRRRIARSGVKGNLVMVTHGSNIAAVTGQTVSQAEALVLAPDGNGGFRVEGSIPAPR